MTQLIPFVELELALLLLNNTSHLGRAQTLTGGRPKYDMLHPMLTALVIHHYTPPHPDLENQASLDISWHFWKSLEFPTFALAKQNISQI